MSAAAKARRPAGAAPNRGLLEAILLVGGQGTRLRPLTLSVPKPLLPTAGVPFVAHQLARAAASGVSRVVLATAYRPEMFAAALGDGSAFGIELEYAIEREPLGTGGGIRNAASRLRTGPDNPVIVLNGDVLSGHDLRAQLELHVESQAAATLHLVHVPDPARYGCVPTDSDGRVTAFLEKTPQPVTNQVNAGCYVFTRRYIDQLPADRVVSVERETFPGLVAGGELVHSYRESAYWLDVGTPESFIRGSCDLVLKRVSSPAVPASDGAALVLPGARVAATARLSAGTVVGARTVVGAGAELVGAVLFDDVCVADGAVVRSSIVGHGARIGAATVLDNVVIGEKASIAAGNELRCGLRVWPGVELGPGAIRFSADAR